MCLTEREQWARSLPLFLRYCDDDRTSFLLAIVDKLSRLFPKPAVRGSWLFPRAESWMGRSSGR